MNIGGYQLLAQISAGRDGVAYRAHDPHGAIVELRCLNVAAKNPEHWQQLIRRVQRAVLLDHPGALKLLEPALANEPPFVVLEWLEPGEHHDRLNTLWATTHAVALATSVSEVLAVAHRLGLVHGRLSPYTLNLTAGMKPRLDFTGIEVGSSPTLEWEVTAACVAPEAKGGILSGAADIYSLGVLFCWLLSGQTAPDSLPALTLERSALLLLLQRMRAIAPTDRPSAQEVRDALGTLLAPAIRQVTLESPSPIAAEVSFLLPTAVAAPMAENLEREKQSRVRLQTPSASEDALLERAQLGRFRLLKRLGQGGMGAVYQAEDSADGSIVAIKVLRGDWARNPNALKRFHKEARLLAEVNNPHVINLLEVNEDDGIHYLVLEFLAGSNLAEELSRRTRFDEPAAIAILTDVARALLEAHERGIVHRDIKPDNILLQMEQANSAAISKVKLLDFGLARHVVETESLSVTQAGTVLGTPYYMAPEQCLGGTVDVRADIYSMGATLFHLLTGRPPFLAPDPLAIMNMHKNEPPPSVQKLIPETSDGIARLVERMLSKLPEARPDSAGALLRELQRLQRGELAEITLHPRLPANDPQRVVQYEWTWELDSSPLALWPYVSNTERLNRAVGLSAIQFTTTHEPGKGMQRRGEIRKLGMTIAYQEHPFEWVEGRRLGVLREFSQGPFKWLVSLTELTPRSAGGTTLTHKIQVEPHGLLGRTAAALEIGLKGRRGLDRVYHRIDAALASKLGRLDLVDPFEEPPQISGASTKRLERILDELGKRGIDPLALEKLGDFLAHAPAQEVARIRPLALARRLGVEPAQMVSACLHGAQTGLLLLLWDILCPVCRIPSEVKETLRALRDHGHCEACNLDFDLDFAGSVEIIFRAHPEIRASELGVFCIGGPAHSPHVVAQLRLAAGERMELELALTEGLYRLRGPQLPYALDLRVQPDGQGRHWEVNLTDGRPDLPRTLKSGAQVLTLTNGHDRELVVRLERAAPREDALTAARASSLALFRELFPGEMLSPGQLVSVATMTFVATALDGAEALYAELGDARAFGVIHEHFRLLDECLRRAGGALVKTVGEGVLAVFSESVRGVEASLALQGILAANAVTCKLRLKVGVHRGPAMAATLNDHLDYFGTTVNCALHLPAIARGGEMVLTQAVAADPAVAALLRSRGLEGELSQLDLPGEPGSVIHRFYSDRLDVKTPTLPR